MAEWIAKFPPRFKAGDLVRFGRGSGAIRTVDSVEVRRKVGAISGNLINAYEYYVRTPGLSGVEESFLGVES